MPADRVIPLSADAAIGARAEVGGGTRAGARGAAGNVAEPPFSLLRMSATGRLVIAVLLAGAVWALTLSVL